MMSKKLFTSLLASMYLMVNIGLTVDAHFCQGSLVDWEIFGETESCCSASEATCCEKEQSQKGCCEEETLNLQFDDWQIAPTHIDLVDLQGALSKSYTLAHHNTFRQGKEIVNHPEAPPPRSIGRWLLYESLTFYD